MVFPPKTHFLFSGTIENNIRLGSEWITDEQILTAAENVNVADFVRSLPEGFKSPVLERGSTMSTGQKQCSISFAQALAHNPKILVLGRSHVQRRYGETEIRVREALDPHGARPDVCHHCAPSLRRVQARRDKIIVMHKGHVREVGTHQQLLAERGIYWKLYQLQYKDQELGVARAQRSERTISRIGTSGNPASETHVKLTALPQAGEHASPIPAKTHPIS